MNKSALPHAQDCWVSPLAANAGGKTDTKKLSAKIPCNSLISLDSDERIQGNPRKSNPLKRGFSQRNGPDPRKPMYGCPRSRKVFLIGLVT